jgi:hypothetical protein
VNTPELSVAERDLAALDHLDAACARLQEAVKVIPNSTKSVFDTDDIRRLDEIIRSLTIITMARADREAAGR